MTEFKDHIQYREVPVILFDAVTVAELAEALARHPIILKSLLSSVNVAQRAIKRDLGITVDTYAKRLSRDKAFALAGYLKPMLPKELEVPALLMLDNFWWVDKEMRAGKGRWEIMVRQALNEHLMSGAFRKVKFTHAGGEFELDAAFPSEGPVQVGVDVKRYESPRDFHKRGDEITQKVNHLRDVYPDARFYVFIYYPFPSKHRDVITRYQGQGIDGIFFAGETPDSIEGPALELLTHAGLLG